VTLQAILRRDLPMAQGTVLFMAVAYLLVNVGVDFVYVFYFEKSEWSFKCEQERDRGRTE